jgi:AcrR family transcriptional regulator
MAPDARRREILTIALDVFSSGEYSTVTMRDVAVRANVNSALVYYYFKSKEQLVAAVIGHSMREALDLYTKRTVGFSDPRAALDEWFRVNVTFFAPLKKMARILVQHQSSTSRHSLIDEQVRKLYYSEQNILHRCIAAGIKLGTFRRLDPEVAAVFISAHLDGICFVSITRPWTNMRAFMRGQWLEIWDYLGCHSIA